MPVPEEMKTFFDKRSKQYDDHIRNSVASFRDIYALIADPIAATAEPVTILDIGCGTGLELEAVLRKAPNARITGIDLSPKMLECLREKYRDRLGQVTLVEGSYLEYPFSKNVYDYVISVMTLHHLLPDRKRAFYRNMRKALKHGGAYIEADYIVTQEKERQMRERFEGLRERHRDIEDGSHHIDIPMSLETQEHVLLDAGFARVDVLWSGKDAAVFVAHLPLHEF